MAVDVAPAWKSRFEFFGDYGLPGSTPESKAAFRRLSFGQRIRIQNNGPAVFFGPFYFFVKGFWRKGITLLAFDLAVSVLLTVTNTADGIGRAVSFGCVFVAMQTANYAYYLHVTQHSTSWNPLEGWFRRRPRD
jgi:predicted small secreted protein